MDSRYSWILAFTALTGLGAGHAAAQDVAAVPNNQSACTPMKGCVCQPWREREGATCLLNTLAILQRPGAPASLSFKVNLDNLRKNGVVSPNLTLESLLQKGVISPGTKLKGGS